MSIRAYGISVSPLTVDLDTAGHGGLALCEIWVKDAGPTTFTVYGSDDGTDGTWRWIAELAVPYRGKDNRHEGYLNAYRFIRVSTPSQTESEIEIIAAEM